MTLTKETIERMDGLALIGSMTAILRNAEEVIHDLCQEGFTMEEAIEYICLQIKEKAPYA